MVKKYVDARFEKGLIKDRRQAKQKTRYEQDETKVATATLRFINGEDVDLEQVMRATTTSKRAKCTTSIPEGRLEKVIITKKLHQTLQANELFFLKSQQIPNLQKLPWTHQYI